jgi:putative FmdB family regulatory protein
MRFAPICGLPAEARPACRAGLESVIIISFESSAFALHHGKLGPMPIYEYRCSSCGHELEALQKLAEAPLLACPSCHADALVKLVSASAFQLKGSGWYATDFKGGAKPAAAKPADAAKPAGEGTSESKSETKSDSASEAKPAAKPETKSESKSESKSQSKAAPATPSGGGTGGAGT